MSDDEEVVDLTAAPASLGVPSDRYKAASHAAQHGYKRPTAARYGIFAVSILQFVLWKKGEE
jgi:hypothetical protein